MSRSGKSVQVWTSIFAATFLCLAGVMQFIQGLVAVLNGGKFFVTTSNYVFRFNLTAWGWIHVILGLLILATGVLLFSGNPVGRTAAVAITAVQAAVTFLWLPYYPVWAVIIIALDVLVIWAVLNVRLDSRSEVG